MSVESTYPSIRVLSEVRFAARTRCPRSRSPALGSSQVAAARSRSAGRCRAARPAMHRGDSNSRLGVRGGSAYRGVGAAEAEKHKPLPPPRCQRSPPASPGTMSAGADSARLTTAREYHGRAHPTPDIPRQPGVIERVEDPVPLRDIQIGLLRRHSPQPSTQQPGRQPEPPQALRPQCRLAAARSSHESMIATLSCL